MTSSCTFNLFILTLCTVSSFSVLQYMREPISHIHQSTLVLSVVLIHQIIVAGYTLGQVTATVRHRSPPFATGPSIFKGQTLPKSRRRSLPNDRSGRVYPMDQSTLKLKSTSAAAQVRLSFDMAEYGTRSTTIVLPLQLSTMSCRICPSFLSGLAKIVSRTKALNVPLCSMIVPSALTPLRLSDLTNIEPRGVTRTGCGLASAGILPSNSGFSQEQSVIVSATFCWNGEVPRQRVFNSDALLISDFEAVRKPVNSAMIVFRFQAVIVELQSRSTFTRIYFYIK